MSNDTPHIRLVPEGAKNYMSNRLRTRVALLALPVVALSLSACADNSANPLPSSSSSTGVAPNASTMSSMPMLTDSPTGSLQMQIYCSTGVGTCYSTGTLGSGEFKAHASNFKASSGYITCGTQPNGDEYTNWQAGSAVNYNGETCSKGLSGMNGDLPTWQWQPAQGINGKPDPAGVYHLTVIDLATSRSISVALTIPSKAGLTG